MISLTEVLIVACMACCTAGLAGLYLRRQMDHAATADAPADPVTMLFDDGVLHHATPSALRRYALLPGAHVWDDLHAALVARFPAFPKLAGSGPPGSLHIASALAEDPGELQLNWRDGLCWVHLVEPDGPAALCGGQTPGDPALQHCADTLQHPAWMTDDSGNILWQNRAFEDAFAICGKTTDHPFATLQQQPEPQRISVGDPQNDPQWFNVTSHPAKGQVMFHATDITELVHAEEAQAVFVQTLAKTFAHLSIGLAIFDRRGQLAIFNPALGDLTGLPASFLIAKPTMLSFFDALRENRKMPEPKNYKTWRQDILEMIAAASGAQYQETWTLEDGHTYAVQGRPHPDGATAFLIEDISADITLSRSFRTDIERLETLLDTVDDALVVFSNAGVLTYSNAAYRQLWGQNPDAAFADVTIADATAHWAKDIANRDILQTLERHVTAIGAKPASQIDLKMTNGTTLHCDLGPLGAETTVIRFCRNPRETGYVSGQRVEPVR